MRFFEQVYQLVRCIPPGRVATYGQIARLLDHPRAARTVGWALQGLREGTDVPWQRVINAAGRISLADPEGAVVQRELLEAEGVVFGPGDRVDLHRYGWEGLPEPKVRALIARVEGPLDEKPFVT